MEEDENLQVEKLLVFIVFKANIGIILEIKIKYIIKYHKEEQFEEINPLDIQPMWPIEE